MNLKPTKNLSYFENGLQIVPTIVGEDERTLQTLHEHMAVVNIAESNNEAVVKILWSIGIRTLDTSVFTDRGRMSPILNSYIH